LVEYLPFSKYYTSSLTRIHVLCSFIPFRRERNRMHAKMTRDRKKCYIASIKRVISKLEEQNQHLRDTLDKSQALSANAEEIIEDLTGGETSASGHKNLEASVDALSALDFATRADSLSSMIGSTSSSSESGLNQNIFSTSLCFDGRDANSLKYETDCMMEKKMDLSHILPSGALVQTGTSAFSANIFTIG